MAYRLVMSGLWPRPSPEPPAGYVAFVERHLRALCSDSADVVGSAGEADLLYPCVLADVAARWRGLEVLRTIGVPRVAEWYLSRAFRYRAKEWRTDAARRQVSIEEFRPDATIEVWFGPADSDPADPVPADPGRAGAGPAGAVPVHADPVHADPVGPAAEGLVSAGSASATAVPATSMSGAVIAASPVVAGPVRAQARSPWAGPVESEPVRPPSTRPRPVRTNLAVRLARYTSAPSSELNVRIEATVAWLHAYQSRQRRWLIAKLVLIVLAFVFLARLGR